MSGEMDRIVKVNITRQTAPLAQTAFNIIAVIGTNATFSGTIQYYSDVASMVADLTGGVDAEEYKAASVIFAQNPTISQVALIKHDGVNMTTTLNTALAESNKFYGLILAERDTADAKAVGDWALVNKKFFCYADSDVSIVNTVLASDTTSLPVYFKGNSNDRAFIFYHTKAATEYLDAGILALILAKQPGSYTASFKTVQGVTVDNLSSNQLTNAESKFCNVFIEIGGKNITLTSYVSLGEFADIIIFQDWLESKIVENVFGLKIRSNKVPYTGAGIGLIGGQLNSALFQGQSVGGISEVAYDDDGNQIGGYTITLPNFATIPTNDKANRVLNNVKFTAWLSGAIHRTVIDGTLTI